MLTADRAVALADRRQRRAVRAAAELAAVLGEPVGFVRRAVPGGAVFDAVTLDSARTCAVVDEHGALRLSPRAARRDPVDAFHEAPAPRFGVGAHEAAERALDTAARPAAGRA